MVQDVYYAKENAAAKAPSGDQKRLPAVCKSIGQKAWGTKELTQQTEDLSKDAKDAINNDGCRSVAHDDISKIGGCRAWGDGLGESQGHDLLGQKKARQSPAHARGIAKINNTET
jgi:hypothetical protein